MQRAAADGEPYPLVLLDSRMPEMDGFALAEQIRRQPDLVGETIMMLVSSDAQKNNERCREVGIHACLMKPLKQSELLNTILELLSTRTPSQTRPVKVEPTQPSAAEGGQRSLRILLAEDNTVNQRLAVRILEKRGHAITLACNGKEAVELSERESFDLVLMDLEMPEMGGFEATSLIRKREKAKGGHIPILALTAHAMKGDRERCLAAGMDGYVAKPVQARELYQAIDTLSLPSVAPPQETPPAGIFDRDTALEHVGGDEDLLRELIDVFLQDYSRMNEEVRTSLSAMDAVRLKRAAHSIKGSSGILGGKRVYDAALQLETIARQGDLSQAESAWQTLHEALEQLKQILMTLKQPT
jgi:CheY-like chemotaxis protein/HPt (histidine-containing phosphotransfer) domain-containing protein